MGLPATFIRFSGCNLCCSFCDTRHQEGRDWRQEEILAEVKEGPGRVVITGGEPLLAGEHLVELIRGIAGMGRKVDIETNGTVSPPAGLAGYIENFVISPKLSNSGNDPETARLAAGLPPGPLKFVANSAMDVEEIKRFAANFSGREILVMPMGSEPFLMISNLERLRGPVEACGWKLLPRLQVLLGIR